MFFSLIRVGGHLSLWGRGGVGSVNLSYSEMAQADDGFSNPEIVLPRTVPSPKPWNSLSDPCIKLRVKVKKSSG